MTDTITPATAAPTVWIRAALPKHLHSAVQKQQAQHFVDEGKRQSFEDALINAIAKGLGLPVVEG